MTNIIVAYFKFRDKDFSVCSALSKWVVGAVWPQSPKCQSWNASQKSFCDIWHDVYFLLSLKEKQRQGLIWTLFICGYDPIIVVRRPETINANYCIFRGISCTVVFCSSNKMHNKEQKK